MRTTFTPSPDIADRLRELVKKSRKSLNAVVNDLLRSALNGESIKESAGEPYRVAPLSLKLRPGLDPEKMTQVLADLDAEGL